MPLRVLNRTYHEKDDLGEYFYRPHRFSKKSRPPPPGEPPTCYWCGLAETAPIHGGAGSLYKFTETGHPPLAGFPRPGPPLGLKEKILGWPATGNIKTHLSHLFILPKKEAEKYMVGDIVDVSLDGTPLGKAQIITLDYTGAKQLKARDSLNGGFGGTLTELKFYLARAGIKEDDTIGKIQLGTPQASKPADLGPSTTQLEEEQKHQAKLLKKVPQETLGGPLDVFFTPGEPEKPKEPAPLTHLKVGDKVEVDIMDHAKLGDFATVVKVDGDLITVSGEGIQPPKYVQGFVPPGATKTYDERHFLEMGFGIHYGSRVDLGGGKSGDEREDYMFYFRFEPPADILAFGLKREDPERFDYYVPIAEFEGKLPAFVQKLKEHHYYQPHGPYFWEVMRGEDSYSKNKLPRKAWELEPVYVQDLVGVRTVVSEDLERRPRFHDEWGVRYNPIEKGLHPTVFTYPTKEMAEVGKKFHDEHGDGKRWEKYGIIERLSQKGQAAVGIARELEPPRFCKDEILSMLKDNERKPWTNAEYNQGWFEALEQAYFKFGGQPKFEGYAGEMDLRLGPGRFRKGEWVYTCRCGREGEREWMTEHLKEAHGIRGAASLEHEFKLLPKRREFVDIR